MIHPVDPVTTAAPMRPPASPPAHLTGPPPVPNQEFRRRQLRIMKRRASGLLVLTTAAFVVVTVIGHGRGWLGYAQAAAEASMVGGLADWFAVTALFRRPLGLPIPHTAIVRERKDQFGRTLGDFVQENFLTPDVISERVRSSQVVGRAAAWLAEPANGQLVSQHLAELAVGVADVVRDEDVHRLLAEAVARGLEAVPLAPLAGRVLRLVTADGREQQLLDSLLPWAERELETHHDQLRARFGSQSPRWVPHAVEDRIFERLLDGVRDLLREVNRDPTHELRVQLHQWVGRIVERLETSPELIERGEELKREILGHAELRRWTASVWTDIKLELRTQASDPQSELRRRLADAVVSGGLRIVADPALSGKAEELAEAGVRYVTENFHTEIVGLVSATIARWDGAETSDKLELLLGPDLQFIRINGTIVGGLAGLVIHAIARAIG